MPSRNEFTPDTAAAVIDRTTQQVRRRAHWPAWMFLALAVVNFAFFVVVGSAGHSVSLALSPLPTLLAVAIFVVASGQPVIGHDAQQINKPIALAGVVTVVVGLVIDQTLLPHRFTGWLVVLVTFMVTPYLVGAWRWLQR